MIKTTSLNYVLRSVVLAAIVSVLGLALSAPQAHAQANTSQNITMSPASTLLSVKAGSSIKKSFELLNSGGGSYSIVTNPSPYRVIGFDYTPDFTQLTGTTETSKWITIDTPVVSLDPQKSATVSYTVTVPKATAPGGYYAVLFAETRPDVQEEATGVVPRNRVGNILYITVEGSVEKAGDATIKNVGGLQFGNSIPLGFTLSNTGGIHFEASVKSVVKNITGKQVYSSNVQRYILPQTQRYIAADWAPSSPVGIYTVSRSAVVAGKEKTYADEKIIYIQPWVLVVVAALIASVIFYFVSRASQRRNSETKQSSKK
jgi:hypothetical protein